MLYRTIETPAHETVEVIPDEAWLARTGADRRALAQFSLAKRPVLGALWKHGAYVHKSGRASRLLYADARALGYESQFVAMAGVFVAPGMDTVIIRDIKGKMCYRIQLATLPETWFRKLDGEWPRTNGHANGSVVLAEANPDHTELLVDNELAAAEAFVLPPTTPVEPRELPAAADEPPAPVERHMTRLTDDEFAAADAAVGEYVPPDDYVPPIDLTIASSVALALLTNVVEIINAGSPEVTDHRIRQLQADLATQGETLAKRLDENNKLRRNENELREQLQSARIRMETLREQLRTSEYNLRQATSTDTQRVVNELVQKELEKIMQAKPAMRT